MIKKKLLTILFIAVLLPVLIVLYQSATAMMTHRRMTTEMSGRYVRNLAEYAADRWNEGNEERMLAFLSIVSDYGYDMFSATGGKEIDIPDPDTLRSVMKTNMKGKFVPGMVAYVTMSRRMILHSKNASILADIFGRAIDETGGLAVGGRGHLVGEFKSGGSDISYVAYIAPTSDPRVFAVAAVTMLSWMGRNNFSVMRLAGAGILGMLICLVALFLIRGSVISPLRMLSSLVSDLRWGSEVPTFDEEGGRPIGDIGVDEISSLKEAVRRLADRMIEKSELETRYVGDIVKAQEEERSRIAQDIHDGPIQVVSALIQKIQIANITNAEISESAKGELVSAEHIAQDLVQELRDICDTLVPPWVSLGAASCVEEAASRLERQHNIKIETFFDDEIRLSQPATLALFRILQEAVSNSARHGGATKVNVEGSSDGGRARITISDNGCGFDPAADDHDELMRNGKRGLNGMRQRVDFLGGECKIESGEGRGTTITLILPEME